MIINDGLENFYFYLLSSRTKKTKALKGNNTNSPSIYVTVKCDAMLKTLHLPLLPPAALNNASIRRNSNPDKLQKKTSFVFSISVSVRVNKRHYMLGSLRQA